MFQNLVLRGFISVIGAFFVSLGVGFMYLWGIIVVYATSYFRISSNNNTLTEATTDITFPLIFLGQAIAMPFAARFVRKTSPRINCLIAGLAMFAIIYMASYCQTFPTFAGLFGLCCGIVIGIIYIIPIAHCHRYFPHKKAAISIIIISASGLGTLIYAYTAYLVINPTNISTKETGGYFGTQVANKFPSYLRILSIMALCFISGGGLLLFDLPQGIDLKKLETKILETKKVSTDNKDNIAYLMEMQFNIPKQQATQLHKNPFGNMNYQMAFINKGYQGGKIYGERDDLQFWPSINEPESQKYVPPHLYDQQNKQTDQGTNKGATQNQCPRVRDGPKQKIFWIMFLCLSLGTNFSLLISGNYKTFAKTIINNDSYLNTIGAIGAVACGLSRFFWGIMLERFNFKILHSLLLIINAFLAFTVIYAVNIREIYFIYVVISYICYGGHLGMFPAVTSQVFGIRYGGQIYGLMFFAYTVSNFIQFILINRVQGYYGLFIVFWVSGGMGVGSLLISNRTQYSNYDWSIRIRQNNQRKRIMAR